MGHPCHDDTAQIEAATLGTKIKYPKASATYTLAESTYSSMTTSNEWSGVTTKGSSPSGFNASHSNSPKKAKGGPTCFNCGEQGHLVPECKKPKNDTAINKRCEEFLSKKGKTNKSPKSSKSNTNSPTQTGKWAPPTSNENNCRVIDGNPMFWATKRNKWVPDKQAHNVQLPTPDKTTQTGGTAAANTAAVANFKQSLMSSLDAFASQMA